MGATLEELEKAGLTELPPIADSFTLASTTLSGISTGGSSPRGDRSTATTPRPTWRT